MTTTLISLPTIVQNISMASYDISWSGSTPVGVITVQVSNTYQQNADGSVRVAGNWTTLVLSAATPVSGNTGNGFVDVDATAGYAIRCVYTPTSGTGSLNVVLNGKAT
jgi:hypothetical protein